MQQVAEGGEARPQQRPAVGVVEVRLSLVGVVEGSGHRLPGRGVEGEGVRPSLGEGEVEVGLQPQQVVLVVEGGVLGGSRCCLLGVRGGSPCRLRHHPAI